MAVWFTVGDITLKPLCPVGEVGAQMSLMSLPGPKDAMYCVFRRSRPRIDKSIFPTVNRTAMGGMLTLLWGAWRPASRRLLEAVRAYFWEAFSY